MRHTKISADKVRIGQVRYFDIERNATEIPEDKAYAFLINVNGVYINPFNPLEELPVYDRERGENYTLDGVPHGTKIKLVNGEVKEGPCYVLEKTDGREIFDKDIVTISDMEDYMFASNNFFVDRMDVAKANRWKPKEMLYRYFQMEEDYIQKMNLDMYLNREKEKVNTK
ncbi:MAG: hypothetical protein IKE63_06355 [Bacilli bacterium]|nr:hypothetical protein [Bacilli bacterium]